MIISTGRTSESEAPYYKTFIFVKDRTVIKVIATTCSIIAELLVMREIAFQTYAKDLSQEKCRFVTPGIQQYGFFKVNEERLDELNTENQIFTGLFGSMDKTGTGLRCFWYFTMEKIDFDSLSDTAKQGLITPLNCQELADLINETRKCLEENSLNHNDYNKGNILVSPNMETIGVIDFGLSACNKGSDSVTRAAYEEYTCEKLEHKGGFKTYKKNKRYKTYKKNKTYKKKNKRYKKKNKRYKTYKRKTNNYLNQ
jgi:serine/threonine protein kinase